MPNGEAATAKTFILLAALLGFTGVALGAFGAHALRARVSASDLDVFETGVKYQMYHALALLAVAWLSTRFPGLATTAAGWLFVFGVVVFSGSLYLLVWTETRWLGAVTPLGGLAFLVGWLLVAWGAWRG